jgi:hypothetical protein
MRRPAQQTKLVQKNLAKNPDFTHLKNLSEKVKYQCNPSHKIESFDGVHPQPIPNKSKCPKGLTNRNGELDNWLKVAFEKGAVSERWMGGFPAQVWFIDEGGRIFEAKQERADSGIYHGYQLEISIPKGLHTLFNGL